MSGPRDSVENVSVEQMLSILAVDIGKRAPGTPIIIDTKATTKKLSQSHHYSVVKTYIYEKDKKAW